MNHSGHRIGFAGATGAGGAETFSATLPSPCAGCLRGHCRRRGGCRGGHPGVHVDRRALPRRFNLHRADGRRPAGLVVRAARRADIRVGLAWRPAARFLGGPGLLWRRLAAQRRPGPERDAGARRNRRVRPSRPQLWPRRPFARPRRLARSGGRAGRCAGDAQPHRLFLCRRQRVVREWPARTRAGLHARAAPGRCRPSRDLPAALRQPVGPCQRERTRGQLQLGRRRASLREPHRHRCPRDTDPGDAQPSAASAWRSRSTTPPRCTR